MSILDLIIAIVLAVCSLYGLMRGFVRIAIGVSGLAVSLALALRLAVRGTDWFGSAISTPELARLAAFVVVLIAGLTATAVAAWIVWRVVRAAHIDWIDRVAGGLIGLVGAAFITCGVLVALLTFLPRGSPLLASSRLLPVAIGIADLAASVLPPELADIYRERREALVEPGKVPDEASGRRMRRSNQDESKRRST